MPTPSPQQQAAIEAFAAGKSFALCARAGSGKTSTIVMMLNAKPATGLALAFNKRNAEELAKRITAGNVTASTLNSVGHRALLRANKVTLDTKKFYQIIDNLNLDLDQTELAALKHDFDLARNLGYVPAKTHGKGFITAEELADQVDSPVELLDTILRESIRLAYHGRIDFGDQIYMPACFNIGLQRHPLIIIDEAQDLSATQHEIVRRSLMPGGQIIVVGDPAQAIYAWRGAMSDSYDALVRQHNLPTLPLTVSYRCPKAVVAYARRYVPDIEAAPNAAEGTVRVTRQVSIPRGGTYICRTNAALVTQAQAMLKRGEIPNYLGRDFTIGIRKILKHYPTESAVDKWYAQERSKTTSGTKLRRLEDQYDTLKALFAAGNPHQTLEFLKENPGGFATLSTVHKAKGLEWPDVTLNLACRWEGEQESNIAYVGCTRAMQTLTIVEV